jgi:hypothetical protein
MKLLKLFLLLFLPALVITSCEKQEYFKSESTIKKEIEYTWHRVQISHTDSPIEYWDFKDGKISISNDTSATGLKGEYSIKTTLTKVFVTTKDFHSANAAHYDGTKWQIIKLDGSVLIMAGEDPQTGSLLQREFTKK